MKTIGLIVYYASYLYLLAAPLLIWLILKGRTRMKFAAAAVLAPLTVLAYARFVEPRLLTVNRTTIALEQCFEQAGSMRIVALSDMHIGMFGNAIPAERIAAAIRKSHPDAVFVAGDWTNYLRQEKFHAAFAPMMQAGVGVYGVLGNHDVGIPGDDVSEQLSAALGDLGIEMMDDRVIGLDLPGASIELVGLSDLWLKRQNLHLVRPPSSRPRIVLTHNPASPNKFPEGTDVDLVISGHTHGGQIFIPGVTCRITFACKITRQGLIRRPRALTFVTTGTGMSGLPFRLLVPPRIDVLDISYRVCGSD